jgi:hypothetical protein
MNWVLASRDTFLPTKIVLKVGFLERDFERDHLAEKSNRTKIAKKYTVRVCQNCPNQLDENKQSLIRAHCALWVYYYKFFECIHNRNANALYEKFFRGILYLMILRNDCLKKKSKFFEFLKHMAKKMPCFYSNFRTFYCHFLMK